MRYLPVLCTPYALILFLLQPIVGATAPTADRWVLAGAGDIASCAGRGDDITAQLLDGIPGTVFTAGDNAYESGRSEEFRNCYGPTWGRHRARTRPTPGNHDYVTPGARGYFDYFKERAGPPGQGYYAYRLGPWLVLALNSNCEHIGGCARGSPQARWVEATLAANPARCALAYWHHPRFSSGMHGSHPRLVAFWQILYAAGVEVVVNGHDHNYERFARQTPSGAPDPVRGIRAFVVGTGGAWLRPVRKSIANSQVRHAGAWGVLKLTLTPLDYTWEFVPQPGRTFTDSGQEACH